MGHCYPGSPMIIQITHKHKQELYNQGSYKKLCDFPNFSRKKLVIFQTFQGDFYLHIHHQNTLKSTFHDKISL